MTSGPVTAEFDSYHGSMTFEHPEPDIDKILAAWEEFEAGEEAPGRVLANMKTAGIHKVLAELVEQGWTPSA